MWTVADRRLSTVNKALEKANSVEYRIRDYRDGRQCFRAWLRVYPKAVHDFQFDLQVSGLMMANHTSIR